jgi:hypothetical protein
MSRKLIDDECEQTPYIHNRLIEQWEEAYNSHDMSPADKALVCVLADIGSLLVHIANALKHQPTIRE